MDERCLESRYILRYIQENLFNDWMRKREGAKIIPKYFGFSCQTDGVAIN